MRARYWLALGLLVVTAPVPLAGRSEARRDVRPAAVSQERGYILNARIRPLLFWIRKNDVGEARITWRADRTGAYGYELLVGSDPLKAPRKINNWGYIAEHVSGSNATIIGVMRGGKADSVEDAETRLAREGQEGYVFETISAAVAGNSFVSETVQVRTPSDLTFRDLEALLALAAGAEAPRRTAPMPEQTDPGFLSSVAELLRECSTAANVSKGRPTLPSPRAYIYNRRLYDLKVQSLKTIADFEASGRRYGTALDADFVATNRLTRRDTNFSIIWGTSGDVAGVPLKIVFRPKWWFEAELVLAR
jgi:hypothetical protein